MNTEELIRQMNLAKGTPKFIELGGYHKLKEYEAILDGKARSFR